MNTAVFRGKTVRTFVGFLGLVLANAGLTGQSLADWPLRDRDLKGSRSLPGATVNVDLQAYTSIWEKVGIEFALTGDVEWDSKLEVVAQSSSGIHILTAQGKQSKFINKPSTLGCLADVNNDGKKEVLLGKRENDNSLSVYVFSGLALQLKRIVVEGSGQTDQGITPLFVADLDSPPDGQLEVVSAGDSGYAIQWRGLEASSLTTGNRKWRVDVGPTTTWGYPTRLANVDGTGGLEIIQGSGGPSNGRTGQDGSVDYASYTWRFNAATGQADWRRQYDCCGFYDSHAFLPDLNGDGRPEIVTTTRRHDWSMGDYGVGTINILNPANGSTANTINFGHYTEYGMFGNLDSMAGDEIVVMTYEGTTGYLRAYGHNLTPKGVYSRSGGWFIPVAISDLTGDGTPEILAVFSNGAGAGNDKLLILNSTLTQVLREIDFGVPEIKQVILSDLDKNGTVEILAVVTDKLVVMSPYPSRAQVEECLVSSDVNCLLSTGTCIADLIGYPSGRLVNAVTAITVGDDICEYGNDRSPANLLQLALDLVSFFVPCVDLMPCIEEQLRDCWACRFALPILVGNNVLNDGATTLFVAQTLSPVEIEVIDGQGNRLYLNDAGTPVSEMAAGWIFSMNNHERFSTVINPVGPMTVLARGAEGAGNGSTFTLGLFHPKTEGYTEVWFTKVPTKAGAIASITVDEATTEYVLAVDLDADGQTDLTWCPAVVNGEPNLACDGDGDGLPNAYDKCPATPAGAIVNADGCSIDQLVPCAGPASGGKWKTHGDYVSAVAHEADKFLAAGLITQAQKDAIVAAAAQSSCGGRK